MLNCPTDSICIRQNYHDKKEKKKPTIFYGTHNAQIPHKKLGDFNELRHRIKSKT